MNSMIFIIIGMVGVGIVIFVLPSNNTHYVSPDESKCLSQNGTYHNDHNQNECWTGDQNSINEYLIGCGDNLRQRVFTNKTIEAQVPTGIFANCFFISEKSGGSLR